MPVKVFVSRLPITSLKDNTRADAAVLPRIGFEPFGGLVVS
jgi:hypothetical protein